MAISLGSLTFDPPLFMAPMEGITDVPFRHILRKMGSPVLCTQMIHAEAILRGSSSRRVRETSALETPEHPVGLQLCGSDAGLISEAAQWAEAQGAAFVDLNMGCPAPNVVKVGAGAALLRNPSEAARVVRQTVKSISIPVTVKIRAGWDQQYLSGLEVARHVEQEGASLLTVHARTRSQRFKGKADWSLFAEIKNRVSIPVVGNGDVFSLEDVERMRNTTPVDGVMIARGALGNPWIFAGKRPSVPEVRDVLLEHLDAHLSFYSERERALKTFRKHLVWYTKGLPHSAEFRMRVFKESEETKIRERIQSFFSEFHGI